MREILEVNNKPFLLKVYYEDRPNASVSVGKKTVNIRIPFSLSREERFRQLLEMKKWAKSKILESPQKFESWEQKNYQDGALLRVGNEDYALKIDFKDKNSSSAKIVGNTVFLCVSANLLKEEQNKHVSALLSRCIARKRLPKLQEKVCELNKRHFNKEIKKIFFKYSKSCWGSCSVNGNINISTRLLFAPDAVLEYVCIHELAHLVEQNHSEKFWGLVETAMPDYKDKKDWLKQNEKNCFF